MIDLRFDRVSKRYLIPHEAEDRSSPHPWMRKLRSLWRAPKEFWAVREVSFEVKRGEALGIIGHNGAGKSTILKLLASITTPSAGEITINGRGRADRGWVGVPSGADRPGERIPEWIDPGHGAKRDRAKARKYHRLLGDSGLHRHTRQAVLLRNVRPAGVCDRCPSGA